MEYRLWITYGAKKLCELYFDAADDTAASAHARGLVASAIEGLPADEVYWQLRDSERRRVDSLLVPGPSNAAEPATVDPAAQFATWVASQRAKGWPSYSRAVYALRRLGIAWERSDEPPKEPERYMQSWWESSRWRGSGTAPEDVRAEIEGSTV